jgi:DnaJ-domain-containing protein 1
VSIGKRLVNLVRSNLSSLWDREDGDSRRTAPIEDLSDEDLEQELRRRRERREAAERVAGDSFDAAAWEEAERAAREGSGRYRTTSTRRGPYRRPGTTTGTASGTFRRPTTSGRDPKVAQLYAQLECPYGSDLATVRKQYRALMLKYHPDMHSGNPEKQRLATELSQRLTTAYNELRRQLSGT